MARHVILKPKRSAVCLSVTLTEWTSDDHNNQLTLHFTRDKICTSLIKMLSFVNLLSDWPLSSPIWHRNNITVVLWLKCVHVVRESGRKTPVMWFKAAWRLQLTHRCEKKQITRKRLALMRKNSYSYTAVQTRRRYAYGTQIPVNSIELGEWTPETNLQAIRLSTCW
jgi:hypothetical protein